MSHWVYIIYSSSVDTYYRGQTDNLQERIRRHNNGWEKSTKSGLPWKLVWYSEVKDRAAAVILERKLKNLSRLRLLDFISKYTDGVAGPDDPDR